MGPIVDCLNEGKLLAPVEARRISWEVAHFTLIESQLYKKGLSQPLLKCLNSSQAFYALE